MGVEMRTPGGVVTTSVKAGRDKVDKQGIRVLRTVEISTGKVEAYRMKPWPEPPADNMV